MPLDPEEEKKFAELRDKCRELKVMPPPEIKIGIQVHDKDGNLTYEDIQRGHSWTRNYWIFMLCSGEFAYSPGGASFGAGYFTSKDVNGNLRNSADTIYTQFGIYNPSANATCGIVVGTGDTAFGIDQYALASIIPHGSSADQLYYQASGSPVCAYTAGSKTWKNTLSRIWNNNSGGSITVKETGLYWNGILCNSNIYNYMLERSILSPAVAVANGAQFTVTYEISMDFSDID